MSSGRSRCTTTGAYAVRVQGRLDARWASRFDGCTLTTDDDGTTVITSSAVDQAALHGVLQAVRDLGLPLVSVTPVEPDDAAPSTRSRRGGCPHTSRSRT